MITTPTVLVLGAGASIPYGYPSGVQLVQEIYSRSSRNDWRELSEACGVPVVALEALKQELYLSEKSSIDAFLEHRPDLMKAGKLAIALALLSCEDSDALSSFGVRSKGIYHYLFAQMAATWEEFKANKLVVITYNYDRSLEEFLFTALKHSYNKSDEEVAAAVQCIPIIHVHGSLGPLNWQDKEGTLYAPLFAHRGDEANWRRKAMLASENIRIVSEAQPESPEFAAAKQYLKTAERIYFLGFGYYSVNLERLGLSEAHVVDPALQDTFSPVHRAALLNKEKHQGSVELKYFDGSSETYNIRPCRGTALGLGTSQIDSIQRRWHIRLPSPAHDALEFLKEYAELS